MIFFATFFYPMIKLLYNPRVVALTTLCLQLSISNDRATWRDTPQDCATRHDPTAESACTALGRGNSFFQRFSVYEPPSQAVNAIFRSEVALVL